MGNLRKRGYEKRLKNALWRKQDFLLGRLKEEWELLEKDEKRHLKRQKLIEGSKTAGIAAAQTVLALAAIAGVVVIAAVAPNIFAAFGRRGHRRFIPQKGFGKTASYLKEKGFAAVKRQGEKYTVTLMAKGRERVIQHSFHQLIIKKPKSWDGNWRIITFDIPEKYKWSREGFRRKLKELGFYHFQKSVFVSPYPCSEEVDFISSLFNISNFVHHIETNKLTNDGALRNYFNLS